MFRDIYRNCKKLNYRVQLGQNISATINSNFWSALLQTQQGVVIKKLL